MSNTNVYFSNKHSICPATDYGLLVNALRTEYQSSLMPLQVYMDQNPPDWGWLAGEGAVTREPLWDDGVMP